MLLNAIPSGIVFREIVNSIDMNDDCWLITSILILVYQKHCSLLLEILMQHMITTMCSETVKYLTEKKDYECKVSQNPKRQRMAGGEFSGLLPSQRACSLRSATPGKINMGYMGSGGEVISKILRTRPLLWFRKPLPISCLGVSKWNFRQCCTVYE